jgi:hypothetical protein
MLKFNVGQEVYYLEEYGFVVEILKSKIKEIVIDEKGIKYKINNGWYRSLDNYKDDYVLSYFNIYATEQEAIEGKEKLILENAKKRIEELNNRFQKEKIRARVVLERE